MQHIPVPLSVNRAEPRAPGLTAHLLVGLALLTLAAAAAAAPVNVNDASVDEIADALNGIGERKAALIVDYRERHGRFRSVDELVNVSGIGDKLLERIRDDVRLGDDAAAETGAKRF